MMSWHATAKLNPEFVRILRTSLPQRRAVFVAALTLVVIVAGGWRRTERFKEDFGKHDTDKGRSQRLFYPDNPDDALLSEGDGLYAGNELSVINYLPTNIGAATVRGVFIEGLFAFLCFGLVYVKLKRVGEEMSDDGGLSDGSMSPAR